MFNHTRKAKFISEIIPDYPSGTSAKTALYFFNWIERLEQQYNTDLCCMDMNQSKEIIDDILNQKKDAMRTWQGITYLYKYVDWCVKTGVPDATDVLRTIEIPSLDRFRQTSLSDPAHLAEYMDCVFFPLSSVCLDVVNRIWYWLAYMGVTQTDALSLTNNHVRLRTRIVHTPSGFDYEIPPEALQTFKIAFNATQFTTRNIKRGDEEITIRRRCSGDLLLRGFKSKPSPTILNSYSWLKEAYKSGRTTQDLSYTSIRSAGLMYRIYQTDQKSGGIIDFTQEVIEDLRAEDTPITEAMMHSRIQRYSTEYYRWKVAFGKL